MECVQTLCQYVLRTYCTEEMHTFHTYVSEQQDDSWISAAETFTWRIVILQQ